LAVAENSLKIAKINYQQALNANHIAIQLADLNTKKAQEATASALLSLENANRSADLAYESAVSSLENTKNITSLSVKSAQSALDEAERLLAASPGDPTCEYNVKTANQKLAQAEADQQSSISSAEDNIGSADIQNSNSGNSAQNSYEQALNGQSSTYWNNINSTQTAQTQIKLTGANIKQAETQLELSNINLELTKLELDKNQISAPFDGIVLSSTFSDGEFAGPGMTAISVISSQFIIKADINETDITKLNPGQKVEITLDAYPDKLFQGEIAEISPISKNLAGIVSFEIKVKPDDSAQSYLKYGLSANVTIIISKVENVLYAPLQSVYEENGKKYVDVLTENNESKKVEITTGNYNYDYIEIKSGL
ncbi:MAG: efflux RND transporter periplasmic adaptor subunit, partial [Firmicutes bacterium]|nr:efflux RND transporter periplasmic adaptor subunit [Bacillota bacterium]